jgi:hypothetical protein
MSRLLSMIQIRQGDVFLTSCQPIQAREEPRERDGTIVLAHGEVTGHAHRIAHRHATTFRDEMTGRRFLRVSGGGVSLSHEEHSTAVVPVGDYEIVIQKRWTDDQEVANVVD